MNGHVNNVTFIQLLENARNRFVDLRTPLKRGEKMTFMLVHFEIDFVAQLFYRGAPEAACRLLELKRSSITLGQAVFDGERPTAVARAVIVNVDRTQGRATPFTDEARMVLETRLP